MNVIAFLNSYTQGKSGGDICFIEIHKRIPEISLQVVTSKLGKKLCNSYNLKATYLVTTHENKFTNIYWTYFLRIIKGIGIVFRSKNIDRIYITSDALPDVLPAVVAKFKFPNARVVGKVFHLIPQSRFISSVLQSVSHFFLKITADFIVVDNVLLKKELATNGFNTAKVIVNYPAVDSKKLKNIRGDKKYTATMMSRLHESKGIFDVISIWKQVVSKNPNATLGIIGTGNISITEKLKQFIEKEQLQHNIELLGFVEDTKAYSLIKGSEVFLFPSHEEGFGIVVAEALALEVPVVAYDLPVFAETFRIYIQPISLFDKTKFAKTVLDILSSSKKYDRVKATSKAISTKFSWEKAAAIEKKHIYETN